MEIKTILLVGSGEDISLIKLKEYSKKSNLIIAVDGGLNHLDSINIIPNIIIGDFDSVNKDVIDKYSNKEKYPNIDIIDFETDKDLTDYELALRHSLTFNSEEIFMFGSTGSFFDHSLANIILLTKYSCNTQQLKIITSNSSIYLIQKSSTIERMNGARVSLFPIANIEDIRLEGFQYEFKKSNLSLFDFSISNIISSDNAIISFKNGNFLIVLFDI